MPVFRAAAIYLAYGKLPTNEGEGKFDSGKV
jgi:hypothetical protein